MDDIAGAQLGPYRILAEIGTGGMGVVYRAEAGDDSARVVAIKVVHPHLLGTPGFFQRFLREADVGKRVDHPNVVRTLEAGEGDLNGQTVHYLVMEFVEGQTLRDLLDELERAPEQFKGEELTPAADHVSLGLLH